MINRVVKRGPAKSSQQTSVIKMPSWQHQSIQIRTSVGCLLSMSNNNTCQSKSEVHTGCLYGHEKVDYELLITLLLMQILRTNIAQVGCKTQVAPLTTHKRQLKYININIKMLTESTFSPVFSHQGSQRIHNRTRTPL